MPETEALNDVYSVSAEGKKSEPVLRVYQHMRELPAGEQETTNQIASSKRIWQHII